MAEVACHRLPDQQANDRHDGLEKPERDADPNPCPCIDTAQPDPNRPREVAEPDGDADQQKTYESGHARNYMKMLVSGLAPQLPRINTASLVSGSAKSIGSELVLITWITLADALTAVLMPLTLSAAGRIPLALFGDFLIIAVAAGSIVFAHRLFRTNLTDEVKRESKHRHWALQLRLSVLLLRALAAIAEGTGGSLLVAGFAAGIVLRRFDEPNRLAQQLTGLASGFFVPAFFVLLGASLDLSALVHSASAIGLALAMAIGATAVHVVGSLASGKEARLPAGLLASAQLGLPAAAAALGLASGLLGPAVAAAVVAGGVLTLIPASAGALLLARKPVATVPA